MLYIGRRVSTDPKSGKLLKLFIICIKRGGKKNHILINHRELLINLLLFFPKRSVSVLLIKKFKLILVCYVVVQRSSLLHYLGREVREKYIRRNFILLQFIEFLYRFKNNKESWNQSLLCFCKKTSQPFCFRYTFIVFQPEPSHLTCLVSGMK